jgi:hypothetical protein
MPHGWMFDKDMRYVGTLPLARKEKRRLAS